MKFFALIIFSCFSLASADALSLVPSLTAQMKKQEQVDKKRVIIERQIKNQSRLAEIRTQNKKLTQAPSVTKPVVSVKIANQSILPPPTPAIKSPSTIAPQGTSSIAGVDMSRVRGYWIDLYNGTRNNLGLSPYSYSSQLDNTAADWNRVFAAAKGQNHHRRNPGDSYYSFSIIDNWFMARGVNPEVVNRVKHTENVGYGYYSCNSGDCTESLMRAIKSTYDFYMSEKGKSYDAHYRSIINPYFTKIGLDIIVVPSEKRYYLTVHYMTK